MTGCTTIQLINNQLVYQTNNSYTKQKSLNVWPTIGFVTIWSSGLHSLWSTCTRTTRIRSTCTRTARIRSPVSIRCSCTLCIWIRSFRWRLWTTRSISRIWSSGCRIWISHPGSFGIWRSCYSLWRSCTCT